ncbi:unnamed protein product [Allacma fusca]|uniref:GB1/RHD3-type G domain-containing protein n=1 Tax=Allacma fusca TaxID=39272 RepID=A0A8J2JUY8_9HEXA|nr:unnamed protein product [Allacma fusca]
MATIQLVEVTESSVKINADALDQILEKVADLPVVILSINGSSREGKSYILNFFLRYLKCQGTGNWWDLILSPGEMFTFKSGRERQTIGLDLYSEPFIVSTKYESKLAVLLLDSQGLFDEHTTFKQNAVIFALSNLFSSVLVYNVKSKMEENLLQNIQFFSSYAQAITTQAEAEDQLPSLMFLVRDFSFEDEFPLGYHSETQVPIGTQENENYFKSCFSLTPTMPLENQLVRKEIQKKYPQIGMFLMPFPGKDFLKDSANNFPEEDFQHYLHQFVVRMMTEPFLIPKQIHGKELTGRELQKKVRQWSHLCETSASKFPEAPSLAESQNIMQNEMALFTSFDIFRERFEEFFKSNPSGVTESILKSKYEEFFQEATQTYRKLRRQETDPTIDKYLLKLSENCGDIYSNYYFKLNQRNLQQEEAVPCHVGVERSDTEVLRTLRKQIETLKESYPPIVNIDPKKPPIKPRRIFTAKISNTGSLIPGQVLPSEPPVIPTTEALEVKPVVAEQPGKLESSQQDSRILKSNTAGSTMELPKSSPLKYRIKNFFTLLFVEPARELKYKVQTFIEGTRRQINRPVSFEKRYSGMKNDYEKMD